MSWSKEQIDHSMRRNTHAGFLTEGCGAKCSDCLRRVITCARRVVVKLNKFV